VERLEGVGVHFHHSAVVSEQAVDFDFDVGGLGIDGAASPSPMSIHNWCIREA
jgi:hypothetical protein